MEEIYLILFRWMLCIFLFENGFSRITGMSFQEHPVSWYEAFNTCRSINETLPSYEQLLSPNFQYKELLRQPNGVWTGNVSIFTPVLSIVGCFETPETNISCRSCVSVPHCYIFCRLSYYFGISATNCFCFKNQSIDSQSPVKNASLCVGGSVNGTFDRFSVVYRKTKTIDGGNVTSNSYEVFVCIKSSLPGKYIFQKMSMPDKESNLFYPVCNSSNGTAYIIPRPERNWAAANSLCIENYGGFLRENISTDKCRLSNWTTEVTFWSDQRSYKSPMSEEEIFHYINLKKTGVLLDGNSNIRCKAVYGSNLRVKEESCFTGRHPFFCVREDDDGSNNDAIILPAALVFMVMLTIGSIFGLYKWNKRGRLSSRESDVIVNNEIPFGLNAASENESRREENFGNPSPSNEPMYPTGEAITYDHTPTFLRTNV